MKSDIRIGLIRYPSLIYRYDVMTYIEIWVAII